MNCLKLVRKLILSDLFTQIIVVRSRNISISLLNKETSFDTGIGGRLCIVQIQLELAYKLAYISSTCDCFIQLVRQYTGSSTDATHVNMRMVLVPIVLVPITVDNTVKYQHYLN